MANATIQYDFERGIERHRFESFCYGPLSCKFYKMGPARSVPYKGFSGFKDEGWQAVRSAMNPLEKLAE